MDTYEKAARIDTLENEFLKEMIDYTGYGSRGTINMVVSLLVTLKERIQRGDKIKLEKTGDFLTLESFEKLLEDEFSTYIQRSHSLPQGLFSGRKFQRGPGPGLFRLQRK